MSFSSLPNEIACEVISYLQLSEVELFARTLMNRWVYAICYPRIRHRLIARRNARDMRSQFGDLVWDNENRIGDIYAYHWRREQCPDLVVHELYPRKDLDYLNLKGDFAWLAPLQPDIEERLKLRMERRPASDDELDRLAASAKRLGVVLPECFLRFMHSEELQCRIPRFKTPYFYLDGDRLRKLPNRCQGGTHGYIVRFMSTYHPAKYYWSLYLDAGKEKWHCVLGSKQDPALCLEDPFERIFDQTLVVQSQKAVLQGPHRNPDFFYNALQLEATNFEEFLVRMYFDNCIALVPRPYCYDERADFLTTPMLEYLDHSSKRERKKKEERALRTTLHNGLWRAYDWTCTDQ